MRYRTAIITRFHYPKRSQDFIWRFDYYKKEVLPRILAQTDQDFEIWIWCEPHHDQLFLALHPKIRVFHATYEKRDSHLFIDFTPYESTEGLPKFHVQCGLDSDELIEPDYIEIIHKHCRGKKKRCITFQGLLLDIKTGKKYYMKRKYGQDRSSAMLAFYQPDIEKDYYFLLQTSAHRAVKYADETIVIPEGHVLVSVHGKNDSTIISRKTRLYNES